MLPADKYPSDTPPSKLNYGSRVQGALGAEPGRHNLPQLRAKGADDMAHKSVGDDKVQFCDEMFPPPPNLSSAKPKPNLDSNPFEALKDAKNMSEAEIARFFAEAINTFGLMPGFKFALCGNRPDSTHVDEFQQKVDAAFYREESAPGDERPHWPEQAIPAEFKRHSIGQDAFDDKRGEAVPAEAESRKKSRGQIISYAELLFAVQQRVALFMFLVMGRRVRFIRWDRSGTYLTTALDYYVEWEFFCDILWRISNRTDEQLGFDPSATRIYPGTPEYQLMTDTAVSQGSDINQEQANVPDGSLDGREFMYVREGFRNSLRPEWPRYKLEVPDGDGVREFLVGRPVFRAKGLAGRGTRGYIALDCHTGRFVWLKDSWRAHYLLVEKEGDILVELNASNVPNVPTLICHGDIRDQETLTPLLWERKNPPTSSTANLSPSLSSSSHSALPSSSTSTKRKRVDDDADYILPQPCDPGNAPDLEQPFREDCPLRLHKHYRMVVEEVGMSLNKFRNGRELVSVVYDCILAHEAAATSPSTQRLHRDISAGNILIYPKFVRDDEYSITFLKWAGILSDWEMSKKKPEDEDKRRPRQPERTGTWQYMAVSILAGNVKIVGIPEELESFFHVILYHAVRYLPSNCDDVTIAYYLDSYFDIYTICDGTWTCGEKKTNTVNNGKLQVGESVHLTFDNAMDDLLAELLSWLSSHYAVERYKRSQTKTQSTSRPSSSLSNIGPPAYLVPKRKGAPSQDRVKRVVDPEPTEIQTTWASYLLSYSNILGCFEDAIASSRWPTVAGKHDRVPLGWKPNRDNPQPTMPTGSRSKRARTDGHAATIVFPLPPAPPVTPKRSRHGFNLKNTGASLK